MTGDWETSDSLVLSFRAKREIFVIRGSSDDVRKKNRKPVIKKPSGIEAATFIPHLSRAFKWNQRNDPPLGLTLHLAIKNSRFCREFFYLIYFFSIGGKVEICAAL